MGKTPVRMKAVIYALSPFQQKVMSGLWKDIPHKIEKKVSENWISATLLLSPLVGTYTSGPPRGADGGDPEEREPSIRKQVGESSKRKRRQGEDWKENKEKSRGSEMGKTPVRMKAVIYALSLFQQKVMIGLWKDIPHKIEKKGSENWINATLFLSPLVGTYKYVQYYKEKEKLEHRY